MAEGIRTATLKARQAVAERMGGELTTGRPGESEVDVLTDRLAIRVYEAKGGAPVVKFRPLPLLLEAEISARPDRYPAVVAVGYQDVVVLFLEDFLRLAGGKGASKSLEAFWPVDRARIGSFCTDSMILTRRRGDGGREQVRDR